MSNIEYLEDTKTKFNNLIKKSQKIAIIPSKIAGVDAFAASVGLYHILKTQEKEVAIIYPGSVPEGATDISEGVEIVSNISNRELVVSVDYSNSEASKVYYNTENDVLFLSISPIDKKFDLSRVSAEIKGHSFDVYITVGVRNLDDIGTIYEDLDDSYFKNNSISLDNSASNSKFSTVNMIDPTASSLSLLILNETASHGYIVVPKAAKAFLKGISHQDVDF